MLKVHAFVRENAPKVLSYKKAQGKLHINRYKSQGGNMNRPYWLPLSILFLLGPKEKSDTPATETTEETNQADEGVNDATDSDKLEKENQPLPEFGQYLYFLFCPTLIYRDQYPM